MQQQELEMLYAALASPLGIELRSSNVELLKQRLYRARRNAADPLLDTLQFRTRPDNLLWIVKGSPDAK